MLPLMAGVVTTRSSQWAPVLIAACIIVPQAIVALASPSVGRKAQVWGRRSLLLVAFGALAIRVSDGDAAIGPKGSALTPAFVDGPYRFEVLSGVSHWIPDEAPVELDRLLGEHLSS